MAIMTDGDFAVFLHAYDWKAPWRAVKEESGMNNTTLMVYAGGDRYVLRMYDNHRDQEIVRIEHDVLFYLIRSGLPIRVPEPVKNRRGNTVTEAPDGKIAALYRYIEGNRPTVENSAHVEGLGRAAGELAKVLGGAAIEAVPIYEPYFCFERTHGAVSNEVLKRLAARFTDKRVASVEAMIVHRERLRALVSRMERLPRQWIHGDIVFNNSVAQGDEIVGLLDFEFATIDARAMEIAVVLAEFPEADSKQAFERIERFCRGYGSAVKLEADEYALLPELIKLRMMDVFLHFAGRLECGIDSESVWEGQIDRTSFVCDWIDRNRDKLASIFRERLLTP